MAAVAPPIYQIKSNSETSTKKNPTKFESLKTDRQTDNLSYDWHEIGKPTIIRDDIISLFSWDELVRDD